jgi:hypothetical protein
LEVEEPIKIVGDLLLLLWGKSGLLARLLDIVIDDLAA